MPQEIAKLKEAVTEQEVHKRGAVFEFITGKLEGKSVVFGAANVRASECTNSLALSPLVLRGVGT